MLPEEGNISSSSLIDLLPINRKVCRSNYREGLKANNFKLKLSIMEWND